MKSFWKWCMDNRRLVEEEVEFGSDFMHDMQHDRDMPRARRYTPLREYIDSLYLGEAADKTFMEMYALYVREELRGEVVDGPCGHRYREEPLDSSEEGELSDPCNRPVNKAKDSNNRCEYCKRDEEITK